jgi:hypothetical protein
MAVRGDITIECDAAFCHAEIVVDSERLWPHGDLRHVVEDEEWEVRDRSVWCPHCIQEREARRAGDSEA